MVILPSTGQRLLIVAAAFLAWLGFGLTAGFAQTVPYPAPNPKNPRAVAQAMAELATKLVGSTRDNDRRAFLDDRFRFEIVAGKNGDALGTLAQLRQLTPTDRSPRPLAGLVLHEVVARAQLAAHQKKLAVASVAKEIFESAIRRLDDRLSAIALGALIGPDGFARDFDALLQKAGRTTAIRVSDARDLIRAYELALVARTLKPFVSGVLADDDRRRYLIAQNIAVKTSDGGTICALVVRPRGVTHPLPALLTFTIYADRDNNLSDARQVAAHGYAGVVGLTRGKGCSPDKIVPYVRDGADADTLIAWIARQPWSDGRVGIYGGSYSGGTAWAAAKHAPAALKAILVGAPVAPGIDVPMEGDVIWSFVYPWPFYTGDNRYLDNTTYSESARWDRLQHRWYLSGRAYRDLDKIDGTPNPVFDEWLAHPTYDRYWQSVIPYREDFAQIRIPVLQTVGYYAGGPGAATYYFTQHYKYDPQAEHYIVIGPYDHFGAQRGTFSTLSPATTTIGGYPLDPAAQIDLYDDLRFKWFDYVLRGGPKPAILQDKVNYEVTGANRWKHAPSFAAMGNRTWRLHLSAAKDGSAYRLDPAPSVGRAIDLAANLSERSDVDRLPGDDDLLGGRPIVSCGLWFESAPIERPLELSGLFSGQIDFVANKKDFDFQVTLYEHRSDGKYFLLAPYWSRASNVSDISNRHLLTPGARTTLAFTSKRLMSHLLQPGSRIVAVLRVIKESGRQINYGTGGDVSGETIADAKPPLSIRWFDDSYLDLPVAGPGQ